MGAHVSSRWGLPVALWPLVVCAVAKFMIQNEDTTFTRARARIQTPGAMRALHVRVCAAACLQMRIRI